MATAVRAAVDHLVAAEVVRLVPAGCDLLDPVEAWTAFPRPAL